jgi:hypothetical protein
VSEAIARTIGVSAARIVLGWKLADELPFTGGRLALNQGGLAMSTISSNSLKVATAAAVLAALGTAVYAQDKYSLKSPSGRSAKSGPIARASSAGLPLTQKP